jgi:nicotinamide riboside kinase
MIKRICFAGGPGVGKSTLATCIFSELKSRDYDVEYVGEYVKQMAYEGRVPQSYDQLNIFATQIHWEDTILRHVPLIVCECPPLLTVFYARMLGFPCWKELLGIAMEWERTHPALNYFIQRSFEYKPKGRFQTLEEAQKLDKDMAMFLAEQIEMESVDFSGKMPWAISSIESLISNIETEIKP